MQKSEMLKIQAEIKSVQTLVDRGLKISVITPEIGPDDATALFTLKGLSGWLLFKPTAITKEDIAQIPEEVREFKNDRTPSQRLRAVIYRVWEQSGAKETFVEFYGRHIDKLVEQYKEQLS